MRKIFTVLLLCFSAVAFKAAAQYDSVLVIGTLDTVLAGEQVLIESYPYVSNQFVTTDASGAFTAKLPVIDSSFGLIIFRIKNCYNDTTHKFKGYSTLLKDKDTVTMTLKFCDSTCKTFKAKMSHPVVKRTVNFANLSPATADHFWWDFGDISYSTQTNPSHTYNLDGTYTVYLLAEDTATTCHSMVRGSPYIKNYVVFIKVVLDSAKVHPITVRYNDPFTGPTDTVFNTNAGGTFFIPLIVDSTVTKSISIRMPNCAGDTVSFSGNFTKALDSVSFNVAYCPVCAKFKPGFNYSQSGSTISFTDTSSGTPLPNKFSWDFGDYKYNTSTLQNPSHRYTTVDSATMNIPVRFIARDSITGCIDTVESLVSFTPLAVDSVLVMGTLDIPLAGQPVVVKSGSYSSTTFTDAFGGYSTYVQVDTAPDSFTAFTFDCYGDSIINPGSYNHISDTVRIDFEYCDTCKPFYSNFTYTQIGNTLFFTDSSSTATTNYSWDFGDYKYNTSTAQNPSHKYTTVDAAVTNVTVRLIARDNVNNCADTTVKAISFSGSAIDSILVKGNIDSMVLGHAVILTYPLNLYSTNTTFTDANGDYLTWIYVDSTATTIFGKITDCYNDTVYNNGSYNHISDTVVINFQYCDVCALIASGFSFANDSDRVFSFANTSSAATDYDWDFGDGNTSLSVNPVNVFANDGNYNVCLIAKDVNNCSDTFCDNVPIYTTLRGLVSLDSSSIIPDTLRVWLVKRDSTSSGILLTGIDSVIITTSDSGKYVFTGLDPGKYLVKAALLPSSLYDTAWMPTYHSQSAMWSGGTIINHISSVANTNADIELIKANNTPGPGFIGGYVIQGANKVGDSLKNIGVLLLNDAGAPQRYVYTDINGEYRFNNLAIGSYRLLVEITGLPSEQYEIAFDNEHTSAPNRHFEVNSTIVKKLYSLPPNVGVSEIENGKYVIYPNPASGYVNVLFNEAVTGEIKITLTDITGRAVLVTKHMAPATGSYLAINTQELKTGLYMINIETDKKRYNSRINIIR